VGSNSESTVSQLSDIFVRIPVPTKIAVADTIESQQPMSSLFEQCLFLLGDVLALMIMEEKQMGKEEIRQFHANLE
jgi:6-phospho-3-hexuloisomerase